MADTKHTLILIKPDAFERGLTGEILARFERKGLKITQLRLLTADEEIANAHYAEHSEKPFFGELVSFITGGPLVAAVLEGHEAVVAARQLIGSTNPVEANTGSIRGDYGLEVTFNLVHGSDSDESAEREIGIWFERVILASASPRRRDILDGARGRVRGRRHRRRRADARASPPRWCSRTRAARRAPAPSSAERGRAAW